MLEPLGEEEEEEDDDEEEEEEEENQIQDTKDDEEDNRSRASSRLANIKVGKNESVDSNFLSRFRVGVGRLKLGVAFLT